MHEKQEKNDRVSDDNQSADLSHFVGFESSLLLRENLTLQQVECTPFDFEMSQSLRRSEVCSDIYYL